MLYRSLLAGKRVLVLLDNASALQIFDEIDHPGGDRIRGKLRSADRQAARAGLLAAGAEGLPGSQSGG